MQVATVRAANSKATEWRPDGREANQFRRTFFRMGEMKEADGSCLYIQGGAKVLCSVFGPLQRFRMRKLDDAAILRCHLYRCRYAGGERQKRKARADKETHQILEQVLGELILLESYPRTRIDIVFRVLEQDGNNVAVCLNAANFALMDAGITMRGLLAVLNCAYVNEQVIVDVCEQDEQDASGAVTVGSINGKAEASFIDLRGCFGREIFKQIVTTGLDACERLHDEFRQQTRAEIARMHTDNPRTAPAAASEQPLADRLDRLQIHEAGEKFQLRPAEYAEYDRPFQPVISDSEGEDDGEEDEEMEAERSELNRAH
ncbi:Exosome complex component RRP41 [Aphelenchoides fujianensis]|nr:Exosome complex component RRP41 [Aphelenchoides fujianensis]